MRKAAATRVLALFRFFFLSGSPPLLGTRGAKVTWATNSFSVGKRLRSGPYSLSTTSTVCRVGPGNFTPRPSRPGDLHPEPLTDSGRKPLDLSGSCHP